MYFCFWKEEGIFPFESKCSYYIGPLESQFFLPESSLSLSIVDILKVFVFLLVNPTKKTVERDVGYTSDSEWCSIFIL